MPESISASAVSHVAICVRNLEQSLRFYRDLLGFTVSKDELQDTSTGGLPHVYHARHAQRRVVHLRYGDRNSVPFMVLTEHPGDTVSGTPIMLDQVGISHISFTVPNVEALTRRLLAAGASTCGPADAFRDASGRLRTVFFRDPDGILVQFDEGGEG
jgi:catechol 2,3-dioxygenase-like lactoylglutathione lyase family enzyme